MTHQLNSPWTNFHSQKSNANTGDSTHDIKCISNTTEEEDESRLWFNCNLNPPISPPPALQQATTRDFYNITSFRPLVQRSCVIFKLELRFSDERKINLYHSHHLL